jgi:hypothetical protein
MSQTFHGTFDPNEIVQDTMENLIEESLDALHTNFSGPSDAPVGVRVASQWCSNTGDNKLKIRNQSNTAWLNVYDFSATAVVLKDGQVGTAQISTSAKKPSIIAGEAISPGSCSLRANFKNVSLPGAANELFSLVNGFGRINSGSWVPLYTTRVYVPSDAGTLSVIARQTTCNMRFVLGGSTSTSSGTVTGPAWGSEAYLDASGISSGWKDFVVQGLTNQGQVPYGGLSGLACRWVV